MPANPPSTTAGPATRRPTGEDQPLTGAETAQVLAELRLAFAYHRVFWEAVRTGVALGAEEVQDQRLTALETPPEANPASDVFLLILMWTVEGPLMATVIGRLRDGIARGLQRGIGLQAAAYRRLIDLRQQEATPAIATARRLAARQVARLEQVQQEATTMNRALRRALDNSERAQAELTRVLAGPRINPNGWGTAVLGQREELRSTALALRGIRNPNLPEYISAALNVSLGQRESLTGLVGAPPAPRGISPGVALRAAVEKQALGLLAESHLQQQAYEASLAAQHPLTAAAAADVLASIGRPVQLDIGDLVERIRLCAAAMIWAELLGATSLRGRRLQEFDARRRVTQRFAADPVRPGYRGPPILFEAPERHRAYLLTRFGPPAETWARENPTDVVVPGGALPGDPAGVENYLDAGNRADPGMLARALTGGDPQAVRLDLIMQWFSALGEQAPSILLSP